MKVKKLYKISDAYNNNVQTNIDSTFIIIDGKYVFRNKHEKLNNEILMSSFARECCKIEIGENVTVARHDIDDIKISENVIIKVNTMGSYYDNMSIDIDILKKHVDGLIVTQVCQRFAIMYNNNIKLVFQVIDLVNSGFIDMETVIFVNGNIKINGVVDNNVDVLNITLNTDYKKLGVGGMNKEFITIFRRAFMSRIIPNDVAKKLGVKHVRGMIMFGPPGCGKTLSARVISKMLNCKNEPKIISGPEIFSKFVGESEQKVRELFRDAEKNPTDFHVIIIDELDAMCRKRGSGVNSHVNDSVVNQLLAKIDGVESLDNILLIGMTNRLDVIDTALLRPGRFEVQIEIGLPDEKGRLEVLNIHTKTMTNGGVMNTDVDLKNISKLTNNFTGAELEGLVKSAVSFATQRHVDMDDMSKLHDIGDISVMASDFQHALSEITPAFGVVDMDELKMITKHGIINVWDKFREFESTLHSAIFEREQNVISILLHGPRGCGKTAILGKIGLEYNIPFVKMISASKMITMSNNEKCIEIVNVFNDASKSNDAIILIDDFERIIEYVDIGPRFSNTVLQCLMVKINDSVNNKLSIVLTTSIDIRTISLLGVKVNVNLTIPVPDNKDVKRHIIDTIGFHKTASTMDGIPVPMKCFYY